MKMFRTLCAVVSLAAFLSACAGREFVRVPNQELVLNQTTMSDIKGRLGEPQSSMRSLRNGKEIRTINYVYASALSTTGVLVGMPSDGVLVGYEYTSNFLNDPTNFDQAVIDSFRQGVTARQDVVGALGTPVGESAFPLLDDPGDREIIYTFTESSPGATTGPRRAMQFGTKTLRVLFGPDDVAKTISYYESNTK
ncbi:MAG: hypothetical protein P1U88_20885 [Thalassobaculaceae bacterium]|nr:hypothetical protein [Thalassobaculaceae bacterium]